MLEINPVYLLIARFHHSDVCATPVWRNWGEFEIMIMLQEKEKLTN